MANVEVKTPVRKILQDVRHGDNEWFRLGRGRTGEGLGLGRGEGGIYLGHKI